MGRLVLAAALAAGLALPTGASASETCYAELGRAYVCRDPEYRACLLYGSLGPDATDFEAGNCPAH